MASAVSANQPEGKISYLSQIVRSAKAVLDYIAPYMEKGKYENLATKLADGLKKGLGKDYSLVTDQFGDVKSYFLSKSDNYMPGGNMTDFRGKDMTISSRPGITGQMDAYAMPGCPSCRPKYPTIDNYLMGR